MKLCHSCRRCIFIWMIYFSQSVIGLLYLGWCRISADSENSIMTRFLCRFSVVCCIGFSHFNCNNKSQTERRRPWRFRKNCCHLQIRNRTAGITASNHISVSSSERTIMPLRTSYCEYFVKKLYSQCLDFWLACSFFSLSFECIFLLYRSTSCVNRSLK